MSTNEVSLFWNDHHHTLFGVFEKLLESGTLVDCTIAAEGQYLKAHKVILSACSSYFELLFSQESEKNPIVVLKDIKFEELRAIIDFVYRGQVKIPRGRLEAFVEVAESLQIKGLGGDSKKNQVPGKRANKSPHEENKKKCSSAVTYKRRKRNSTNSIEDVRSGIGQQTSANSDENSNETTLQSTSLLAQALLATSAARPVLASSPFSAVPCGNLFTPTIETEESVVKTDPASYTDHTTDTPTILPEPEIVVKTELEPITQIFLPESENLEDSKNTETALQMLQSTSQEELGETAAGNISDDQSTNQYSGADSPLWDDVGLSEELLEPEASRGPLLQALNEGSAGSFDSLPPTSSAAPARRYGCSKCGKAFPAAFQLKRHMRMHSGALPFVCKVCGERFTHLSTLKTHMNCHSSERPFKCRECGKAFTLPSYLKVHERIHSEQRPFACHTCGHSFHVLSQLEAHQSVHSQEKRHRCNFCNAAFRRAGEANEHMRIHTGEKPYECDMCPLRFNNRGNFYRHKRTVHGTALGETSVAQRAASSRSKSSKRGSVSEKEGKTSPGV